tara:strand:+ start:174 stop:695 length:522 start_codon:yes stop_codon:yes gene_type:complete
MGKNTPLIYTGRQAREWVGEKLSDLLLRPRAPIYVGVDPSTKAHAVCIVQEGKIIGVPVPQGHLPDFFRFMGRRRGIAVIEGQYIGPNKAGALALSWAAGEMCAALGLTGLTVVQVPPTRWQRDLLGTKPRDKREERKRRAGIVAREIVGNGQKLTQDMADAILIAHWGIVNA